MQLIILVVQVDESIWIDISVIKCPNCGKLYADASWYVVDMESEIECTKCGYTFNTRENLIDRILVRLVVKGEQVDKVSLEKHLIDDKS